jgi:threonine dehydratase
MTARVGRPGLDAIRLAAEGLRGIVVHTPLVAYRGDPGDGDRSAGILLKPEIHQPVGSFKLRGVFHAVASLPAEAREAGIATVSAGNTAQALAWAGRHFGVPARSLMPDTAPRTKIDAVRALGGEPVLVPVAELFRFLRERGWESEPYAFVHPWTSRELITGHASLGLEILDDRPEVETVYVPVGGGGLLAGVGSAIRQLAPSVRLVAVEPEGCPSLHAALDAGKPVTVPCKTICDGVAVPYITEEMFPLLSELADDVVVVSERAVRAAVRSLALGNRIVAEPSGALALAAALATPASERGESVCLVTGGSIDRELLVEILSDDAA